MFCFSLAASGQSLWERLAVWYESSVLHELFTYFRETYFTIESRNYEHLPLGPNAASTAETVIFSLAVAVILVSFLNYYTRVYLGRIVRKLVKEEAHSPESAKTLMELGFFRSSLVRRELSKGTALRRFVHCVEEEQFLAEQEKNVDAKEGEKVEKTQHVSAKSAKEKGYRMDFLTARFYIPQDLRHRASVRYERKGSGLPALLLVILGVLVFSALACRFFPDLLQLLNNLVGMSAPQ